MDHAVMCERSITLSLKFALFLCTFLFCPLVLCNGQQEQVRMTMLLKGHFNSNGPNTEYQCYLSDRHEGATVESFRAVNTRNIGRYPDQNPDPPDPIKTSGTYPHWKVTLDNNNNNDFGVFGCRARRQGRRNTEVTGVFMRSDAHFTPRGRLFSKTVALGDRDVQIMMAQTGRFGVTYNPRWLKDDVIEISQHDSPTYSIAHNIQSDDAAVYGCFRNRMRDEAKHGIQILIVRACPEGRWDPGNSCSGVCGNCYNGGICDEVTGNCICAPGFRGNNCQIACGGNRFGHTCEFRCSETDEPNRCRNYLFCLVHPFGCRCNTGWKELNCNEPCNRGTYGASCLQTCHCRSGQCDRYTGVCTGSPRGCSTGWTGTNCQACVAGKFGTNCQHTCNCRSGECNIVTGFCTGTPTGCTNGWRGRTCQLECVAGTFGANCDNTCHCQSRECNRFTGTCTGRTTDCMSGWRGSSCHRECGARTFGANCDNTCHCQSGECDRFTGICTGRTTDCISGWRGSSCHQVCGTGTFGSNCDNTCHCQSGECDRFTGTCTGSTTDCMSGWRGSTCQEALLTSAPEEVTKGSLSITISWPAWNGNINARDPPIIGYIPYHKNTSATEWIPGSSDPVQTLNFTFSDLTPDTNYSFRVTVVREGNEEGPKSPKLVVKTTCAVPSSPTNLTLEPFGGEQDRLTISWQMPSSQDVKCSSGVTQMTLYYSNNTERGSEVSEVIIDVSNTYTFNVSLEEGEYTFQLSMTTAGGESSKSQPIYHSITDTTLEFDISSDLVETKVSIPMVYVVLVAGAILILFLTFLIGSLVGRRCSNTAPFPQALNTTENISAKDSPEYTLPTEETKDDMSHDYQDLSSKFDVSAKVFPRKRSEEEPSHTYQEITSKSDEPDYLIPSERPRDKPYHEYQDEATSNVQKEKMMLESHVQAKSLLGEVEQDDKSYAVPSALKKCTELYLNVAKGTKSKPIAQIEI